MGALEGNAREGMIVGHHQGLEVLDRNYSGENTWQ